MGIASESNGNMDPIEVHEPITTDETTSAPSTSTVADIPPVYRSYVFSGTLGVTLSLRELYLHCRVTRFDPGTSPAATISFPDIPGSVVARVFKKGVFLIMGASSKEVAVLVARRLVAIARAIGHPDAVCTELILRNGVAVGSVPFPIQLDLLAEQTPRCLYLPDVKSSATLRMDSPACCCHVSASGRVVITGIKSSDDLAAAWKVLRPILADARATTLTNAADRKIADNNTFSAGVFGGAAGAGGGGGGAGNMGEDEWHDESEGDAGGWDD